MKELPQIMGFNENVGLPSKDASSEVTLLRDGMSWRLQIS